MSLWGANDARGTLIEPLNQLIKAVTGDVEC